MTSRAFLVRGRTVQSSTKRSLSVGGDARHVIDAAARDVDSRPTLTVFRSIEDNPSSPPPVDQEEYDRMERLFDKYREFERTQSVHQSKGNQRNTQRQLQRAFPGEFDDLGLWGLSRTQRRCVDDQRRQHKEVGTTDTGQSQRQQRQQQQQRKELRLRSSSATSLYRLPQTAHVTNTRYEKLTVRGPAGFTDGHQSQNAATTPSTAVNVKQLRMRKSVDTELTMSSKLRLPAKFSSGRSADEAPRSNNSLAVKARVGRIQTNNESKNAMKQRVAMVDSSSTSSISSLQSLDIGDSVFDNNRLEDPSRVIKAMPRSSATQVNKRRVINKSAKFVPPKPSAATSTVTKQPLAMASSALTSLTSSVDIRMCRRSRSSGAVQRQRTHNMQIISVPVESIRRSHVPTSTRQFSHASSNQTGNCQAGRRENVRGLATATGRRNNTDTGVVITRRGNVQLVPRTKSVDRLLTSNKADRIARHVIDDVTPCKVNISDAIVRQRSVAAVMSGRGRPSNSITCTVETESIPVKRLSRLDAHRIHAADGSAASGSSTTFGSKLTSYSGATLKYDRSRSFDSGSVVDWLLKRQEMANRTDLPRNQDTLSYHPHSGRLLLTPALRSVAALPSTTNHTDAHGGKSLHRKDWPHHSQSSACSSSTSICINSEDELHVNGTKHVVVDGDPKSGGQEWQPRIEWLSMTGARHVRQQLERHDETQHQQDHGIHEITADITGLDDYRKLKQVDSAEMTLLTTMSCNIGDF